MSGIEAAGLVLAVFPIVVSGLQHFTEGVETIKAWKRYQRELAKYARTLETQRVVYLNTIDRLFEGIIESNEELEAFMKDPGAAFSHKPQYEDRLRTRLGRSYDNYNKIMADMLDALKAARKELGIDENGKVRSPTVSTSTVNIRLATHYLTLLCCDRLSGTTTPHLNDNSKG